MRNVKLEWMPMKYIRLLSLVFIFASFLSHHRKKNATNKIKFIEGIQLLLPHYFLSSRNAIGHSEVNKPTIIKYNTNILKIQYKYIVGCKSC